MTYQNITNIVKDDENTTKELSASASFWCRRICEGEKLQLYSSRDGKYLKRIASSQSIPADKSCALLFEELKEHEVLREMVSEGACYPKGSSRYKALLYLLRARIYYRHGQQEQAATDVKCSLAYSDCEQSEFYFANITFAQIYEHSGDEISASLCLALALRHSKVSDDTVENWMVGLLERLPFSAREAYVQSGCQGLKEWIDYQRELQKPPILQKRPKFYWYYQWMTKRIERKCGLLPAPIMDKLLCLDATDLDTLLMSTPAIQAQALEFWWILQEKGPKALGVYKTPELTWEEVKLIKEIKDIETDPPNLLKNSESKFDEQVMNSFLQAPDKFMTRNEQLLLHKCRNLRITNEQNVSN